MMGCSCLLSLDTSRVSKGWRRTVCSLQQGRPAGGLYVCLIAQNGPKLAAQGGPRSEVLQQPNRSLIAALQSCSSPTEG